MEYIKGKWYKINNSWYACYDKTTYNNWYYLESITISGKYQRHQDGANVDYRNDIKLLDSLQEIQQWLPNDHPQKITPIIQEVKEQQLIEEAKRRYPIGTKFKTIYGKPKIAIVDGIPFIYKNCDISDNIIVKVKEGSNDCLEFSIYSHNKGWAEIVEDKWIPKVGDWVYDINNRFINIRNNPCQISKVNNDEIWCKDKIGESFLKLKEFINLYRKALPHEIPNQSLVGRYLKYIGADYGSKPYPGEYFLIQDDGNTGLLRLSDNTPKCYWDKTFINFELMPEGFKPDYSSKNQYFSKIQENNYGYNIGGWVKCLYNLGDCKINHYYQILGKDFGGQGKDFGGQVVIVDTPNKQKLGILCGFHIPLQCEYVGMEKPLDACFIQSYDQALVKEMQEFGSKDYTVRVDPIMDYGTKDKINISVKDFYNKHWIVNGIKSKTKLIEVIPLQQVKELRQSKKSKLITI